ncbi:4-hydroxybenzoate polyprenyl transferase [Nadsonia fulvescens var. elongata DSM 6958]|uniref:4-hydroxybenzoate polyprenyltransferase, mitochondrial n=1 Tax=Nadsonia fulvescens var. elongata DSM 6958 TaxID=857566 RepID=A0A1E3PS87_9ASCO|nr:4-hydroxybenzoate polyprenyl transferase [Nadsonia fulvescens var. elongata DSM 6958]
MLPLRFINARIGLRSATSYILNPQAISLPYAQLMRLDKPVGTWLLFIPGTWAITMAAYSSSAPISQTLWMLTLFGAGSLIMRGAGCTINDICDRKLDAQVERTVGRPIASGRVSIPQASTFLASQMAVGFGILYALPTDCYLLGCASLPLVFTYPLFKRFTYYPQVVLSACFTWAALLGFPAMGVWDWPVMGSLYSSCFLWCMTYDTIYAHQDKKFDVLAGIKSTALAWGDKTKPIITGLSVGQVGLLTTAGVLNGMGPGFFAAVGYASYRLAQMIYKVDLDNPEDCWMWFVNNISTGQYIWAGATVDYALRLAGFI